jgi:hypothetical protein
MIDLAPLEALYEVEQGNDLPLPPELASRYGRLQFPRTPTGPMSSAALSRRWMASCR